MSQPSQIRSPEENVLLIGSLGSGRVLTAKEAFTRYVAADNAPFCVMVWERGGFHAYSVYCARDAKALAQRLSERRRYAAVHTMRAGIPQSIEYVYRDGHKEKIVDPDCPRG